ncbi:MULTISPECIES: RDD family protein [unclassified Pseudomonas]|uniref:RDD family protein n=1 Tax=unclassified Pseudomonas TaxID=196821 RepID=UPI002446B76B|nr:RDD family protein [Pseudomonas sp. GD03944]MDH1261380.1 RDD family protein [Pseudomonas sp. GD03944]
MIDPNNPYQAPQAALNEHVPGELPHASRGARLGAVIIDTVLLMAITGPISYFNGDFERIAQGVVPSLWEQVLNLVLGMAIFMLINGAWLKRYGQTVGKRICKVRIVTMQGQIPDLPGLVLKRYVSVWLLTLIPTLGGLLCVINYLFIFRRDRRCVHDHLAGTRVVPAE